MSNDAIQRAESGLLRYIPVGIRRRFTGRPALLRAISNSGWLLADNAIRMGVGFFVSIWVTRYLGPEQYGQLSYALAFVMLFSSVGLLGLEGVVVRNLVREPDQSNEILGSAFILRVGGGGAALVLTLLISLLVTQDNATRLLIVIIASGALFQMFTTIDFWFQSRTACRYGAYARSGSSLLISAGKLVLVYLHAPLVAFAWAGALEILLGSIGLLMVYRISGGHITQWRIRASMVNELLRDSWPLFFSDIVMLIYLRVDRIMLGEMAGNRELGIYSVAAMLAEAFYVIPLVVYPSVFPGLVEARHRDEALLEVRMQQFYNLMAFLAYGVAIPLTFLSGWLVPLMFGDTYASAAPLLVGLVWAGLFYSLMVARSQFLTAMNWTRLHFITDVLGAILNIVLNLLLIPQYGAMGAVIASLIAYWFVAHGSCFLFRPLYKTGVMMTRAIIWPRVW